MALFDDRPLKKSRLHVETDLNVLPKVLQWFEQFNMPPLSSNFWWQCQLALTEGFTNAVRHAHVNLPQTTPIYIEVTVFSNCLEMLIWDFGQPFNLEERLHSLAYQDFDPLEQEGGRGLRWMRDLTDEIHYIRQNDTGNCLVMRKKIG